MKKALIIALELLTFACWGGAFAVQYFTERRLGMTRWVNYHYGKLTEAVPYETLKYVLVALVVAAALLLSWRLLRRMGTQGRSRRSFGAKTGAAASSADGPLAGILAAVALMSVAAFVVVALLVTHDLTHADFLLVALFGLAALFQLGVLASLGASMSRRP